MSKKRFLLRLDPRLYTVLERWAADEFRSVNGQIEHLLAEAARRSGRWGAGKSAAERRTLTAEAESEPVDE